MEIHFNGPVQNVYTGNTEVYNDNAKKVVINTSTSSPNPATQHAQQAQVVEDVVPVTTSQPTEEPIVETTDTTDEQALSLEKRQKALDMIMKCHSYFKEGTENIIRDALNSLAKDKYAHLEDALSGQEFTTTVCAMIGVALEEGLFTTTKKRDLGRCVADDCYRFETTEKYIGQTASKQRLLNPWRNYLKK